MGNKKMDGYVQKHHWKLSVKPKDVWRGRKKQDKFH